MPRSFSRSGKAGLAPGTIVYVGNKRSNPIVITCTRYTVDHIEERTVSEISEVCPLKEDEGVVWYNIDGVHDAGILQKIGEVFGLHPLVVEDIANTDQRPKVEDFDRHIFLTLKMIVYDKETNQIRPENVSIVFGRNFVLSFLEDPGDVFDSVRDRLRSARGRIRKLGADYLAYALVDSIVDTYFEVLEELGDDIEEVEEEVVDSPNNSTLHRIHTLKRELIYLRRAVWPLRDSVNILLRDESDLVRDDTRIFLRDLYDHAIHVIDSVETFRDIVSGMLDVYLSSVSNKMNQIMKVLTVMSSIFIPLTFIAGVYGMNFDNMPELHWRYGYPVTLAVMVVVAISFLIGFRKRGWL